jgi:hypothetical protein
MGILSVLGVIEGYEPFIWPLLGIVCAWLISRSVQKRFAHGFLTGLIGGTVAPLIQALFLSTYLANNPRATEDLRQLPPGFSAQLLFFLLVPVIAMLSGLALGFLAWLAGKLGSRGERQP